MMWQRPWFRFLVYLAVTIGIAWFFWTARAAFSALLLSLGFAYILSPLIARIEALGVRRTIAVLAFVFSLFLGSALVLLFTIPLLIEQFAFLVEDLPEKLAQLQQVAVPWVEETFQISIPGSYKEITNRFRNLDMEQMEIWQRLSPVGSIIAQIGTSIVGTIAVVLNFVLIPVFTFYLLLDLPKVKAVIAEVIPPRYRESAFRIGNEMDAALASFIRGQLLVMLILGVLFSLALWIAGVRLWLLVGLFGGAMSFIPYFGGAASLLPGMILAYVEHSDLYHPLLVLVLFTGIQMVEGNLITPKIVGETVGLHPVVVMLALLIAAQFLGFIGVLIAVPLAAVLKVLAKELYDLYLTSEFYQGGPPTPEPVAAVAESTASTKGETLSSPEG